MAKETYVGISNRARKVKGIYVGLNGKAREVVKGYVGVNGKARLFWESGPKALSWKQATMPGDGWYDIVFGSGKFVAVGAKNKIAYSTDGITWKASTPPVEFSGFAIAYGGGKFVVLPRFVEDATLYSTDGITWKVSQLSAPSSDSYWKDITYGDGKFVVMGSGVTAEAAYSTDGINWTRFNLSKPVQETTWEGISYGNGKFVVIGNRPGYAAYSTNGINWTSTAFPFSARCEDIAYGNGKFVCVTDISKGAYSTDGIHWVEMDLPGKSGIVGYGDHGFVIDYDFYDFAYSTDGITWEIDEIRPIIEQSKDAIAFGNGRYVVVGSVSATAMYTE